MGIFFKYLIFAAPGKILFSGFPEYFFQRSFWRRSFNGLRRHRHRAESQSFFRFYDDRISGNQNKGAAVKIIYLAAGFKSYADFFSHIRALPSIDCPLAIDLTMLIAITSRVNRKFALAAISF